MAAVKPLDLVLDEALDKLVIISPDKRTYDSITSVMFQLYCGNDYGMGDNNLSFLDKVENNWRKGRKRVAKIRGLSLVKNA
tara:strand:- start:295 stop:537 length:243 start_codon:yes stop_codon:yes gene_type:complete